MSLFSYIKTLFTADTRHISLDGLSGTAKADAILHNLVAEKAIPGVSISVVKEGKTILEKGYGYANLSNPGKLIPSATQYRIASISKCITGLAFGKMVEDGIVNWDDSIYTYLPYYPKKKFDFTLRQLAAHTAGIRSYRGKEWALNKPYTIKESISVFKDDPLEFEPGQGYLYNSFGFVLLSLALQEASGAPFENYVKEKILRPLKMNHTITPLELILKYTQEKEGVKPVFYSKRAASFTEATPVHNFYKLAGGGYLSTSSDITKLGAAILDKKLLKRETYSELLTAQTVKGESTYYGLGFQVSQDSKGRNFYGHVGNSVGAYSNFFIFPKEKLSIAILINCTDPKVQPVLDTVVEASLEDVPIQLV